MNKIGLVILNFLTYEDTYDSIKTLSDKLVKNVELEIYIVDNATDDIRYNEFKKDIIKLDIDFKIQYLASKENLGFARGMNVGIDKARENGCNFVICSNNDIGYKSIIDFNIFIDIYNKDNTIAAIGPKILNPDGENQNPYILDNESKNNFKNKLKQKLIFSNFIGKLIFFLIGYIKYNREQLGTKETSKSQSIYSLHGAFFMLTPAYFKYFKELDNNTFLYNEELILAERIKQNNLVIYYFNDMEVFHKDDSSTNEMLGKDSFKKINFILNENYKSRSYFFKKYKW